MSNELVQEYEYRIGEERAYVTILCCLGFVLLVASSLLLETSYRSWPDYVFAAFVLFVGGIFICLVLHCRVERVVKVFQDHILVPRAPFFKIHEKIFFSDIKNVSLKHLYRQGFFLVIEQNDSKKNYLTYRFMSRKAFCELLHYIEAQAGLTQSQHVTPQWFIEYFRLRTPRKILVVIIAMVMLYTEFFMGFNKQTIKEALYFTCWIGFMLYVISCLADRERHS